MLSIGQTIERYTVDAFVGQGGMAVVYRVRHNRLGSLHALKVLAVARPGIRERLLREGRVQAGLHHPNVVAVTDVLDLSGTPALLMEYVPGPTLETWLEDNSPTLDEALALFRGVCTGVGEAHTRDLVHRDLKPANVLLAPRSAGVIPKVTDFGIAKIVRDTQTPGATGSQVAMGTPCYMAPEQIRDARSVDQRADIFSLGCMLYELVTGVRPFDGPDVLSLLNSVARGEYLPPRERVPDLPDEVVKTIDGALQIDADERIPDCATLLDTLGGLAGRGGRPVPLESGPIRVSPDTSDNIPTSWDSAEDLTPPSLHPQGEVATVPTPPVRAEADRSPTPSGQPFDSEAATVPVPSPRYAGSSDSHPQPSYGRNILLGVAMGALLSLALITVLVVLSLDTGSSATGPKHQIPADALSRAPEVVAAPEQDAPPEVAPPQADTHLEPTHAPTHSSPVEGFHKPRRFQRAEHGFLFPKVGEPDPEPGRVVVSGDIRSAEVVSEDARLSPGSVPPGKYRIEISYQGEPPTVATEVEVRSGRLVRLICFADEHRCTLK